MNPGLTLRKDNTIWDLDKALPVMNSEFDEQVLIDSFDFCHTIYNEKLHTVMLSVQKQLVMFDARSGQKIVHDLHIHKFEMIDDYTIGFVVHYGLGTVDLRMMQRDFMYNAV
jgi:hypothetical protein